MFFRFVGMMNVVKKSTQWMDSAITFPETILLTMEKIIKIEVVSNLSSNTFFINLRVNWEQTNWSIVTEVLSSDIAMYIVFLCSKTY